MTDETDSFDPCRILAEEDHAAAGRAPPQIGRPSWRERRDVYLRLVQAAEECLQEGTFASIKVRQIAAMAGVNPAMITYYFGGKLGLISAVIRFVYNDWFKGILRIEQGLADPAIDPIAALAELIDGCFYRHAGVAKLVRHELALERSAVRDDFEARLASRSAKAVQRLVVKGARSGRFRADLDERYVSYIVVTVAQHPVGLGPALEASYAIPPQELLGDGWRRFLLQLLQQLLGVPAAAEMPAAPRS